MPKDATGEPLTELGESLQQAIRRFVEDLDEKNRRRAAGILALVLGRGGVAALGRITGLSHTTIERGRREVEEGTLGARDRIRAPGGGVSRREKPRPRRSARDVDAR